jgi:long-chain acyl-CoA synthetase
MKGYYNKPQDTQAVITPDGWYKTGDMASVDADGYITITGRKKEMIIVGGENVYPREIESVLDTHPAVAESAVVGRLDASRGEVVVAFVILKEGQETTEIALRDYCRGRVAGYKTPRRVIIAQDLPRGPTGKILKRSLKEML